ELLTETPLNTTQQGYVQVLNRAGSSLMTLINDILDLSKIEAGQFDLEQEPFPLRPLLDEVIEVMRAPQDTHEVTLTLERDPNLPYWVVGDVQRLRQVLFNLVGNALKFTHEGHVTLKAKSMEPQHVYFEVNDSGIGVPKDLHEDIFNAFTQADSSVTRRFGGTGLGLAICQRLVERMGGTITLESDLGEGSSFCFTIPLPKAEGHQEPEPPTTTRTLNQSTQQEEERPLAILVVDDAEENRLLIQAFLTHSPHTITMAVNGAEALEMARLEPFDIILMDIQMPVMDGYTATRAIRAWESENGRQPPAIIIALTAHAMREHVVAALEAGCDRHMSKPVRKAKLLAALRGQEG
ncbi:MAG: response regulator, partial [Magnetococcales bacterium]|nr:response regulator [Magnetococcales bacterium]